MLKDATATESDAARNWVREIIKALGSDATNVARLAGMSQPTLTRFLKGSTEQLSTRSLLALSQIAPIQPPQTVRLILDRIQPQARKLDMGAISKNDNTLPVWGVHPLYPDGPFHLNAVELQRLRRPSNLAASFRTIAFYAPDETMAPRWQMGEPVLVDLTRPGTVGKFVLVRLSPDHDPNAEEVYLFRRYDGRRDGNVLLSMLANNEATQTVPISRVQEVRRVLDWADLLG